VCVSQRDYRRIPPTPAAHRISKKLT
ncbi:brain-specific serine protease 4, partial [Danaus plexippus plexippus]